MSHLELSSEAIPRLKQILQEVANRYEVERLQRVLESPRTAFYEKDIFVSLRNILAASLSEKPEEALKEASNIYGAPIFKIGQKDEYLIQRVPDWEKAIQDLKNFYFCFELNAYMVVNTYLALIVSQITGFDLQGLFEKGLKHIEESIDFELKNNPRWNRDELQTTDPLLIIPVGAAGSGKSTLYKELPNVLNICCDNIRYLLFKDFGPCFSPWESTLSWWVVFALTDHYLRKGFSVFYNGVNTDREYRSPLTMEVEDPLYEGIPYRIKIVYFEPPVPLSREELEILRSINLWQTPFEKLNLEDYPPAVQEILKVIHENYQRTVERSKLIQEGKAEQNPFDVLYCVPLPVVKLFMEQSYDRPVGDNVVVIPRKNIPDPEERRKFYREYAKMILER